MTAVAARLAARLAANGPVTFAAVMEEALYGAGGYYARDQLAIGAGGDFVTGSSLSPLFGRVTARLVDRLTAELGAAADYLEVGYGNGEHLRAVAERLSDRERGRLLAWDRVPRQVPAGVVRLDRLGDGAVDGLVFSYELFDALPVHRLVGRAAGEGVGELLVGWSEAAGFHYLAGDLSDPALIDLLGGRSLAVGQVADVAPGWRPLYRSLARALGRGLIVTCDYGYERERLFDPRVRRNGTLACHAGHRVHRDALARLGEEDLGAHVDWTALREVGENEGLETVVLTRQALWLVAGGLFAELSGNGADQGGARALLDGDGMGEEIRVLVQSRGVRAGSVLDLEILGAGEGPGTGS